MPVKTSDEFKQIFTKLIRAQRKKSKAELSQELAFNVCAKTDQAIKMLVNRF